MLYRSMRCPNPFLEISDEQLIAETARLVANERGATVALVAAIAEVDSRRLYLGEGCSSLFAYCTRILHLSEHAAYGRIEAARAAKRFPLVLELLSAGSLTLTTVTLLAAHLTTENHLAVLRAARYKTKREVEEQVAALRPLPAVPPVVRKLPQRRRIRQAAPVLVTSDRQAAMQPADFTASSSRPAVVKPLAPELFKVQFTVTRETHDKLRRAQDLLRHAIPNGDPAVIFDRALTLLLAEIDRTRLAAVDDPRKERSRTPESRHIPAAVRRAVWTRDRGQCGFVGTQGRCESRGFLEFHHVDPYAAGGPATVDNIALRCRAHNAYEATLFFGALDGVLVRESSAVYAAELGPDRVGMAPQDRAREGR